MVTGFQGFGSKAAGLHQDLALVASRRRQAETCFEVHLCLQNRWGLWRNRKSLGRSQPVASANVDPRIVRIGQSRGPYYVGQQGNPRCRVTKMLFLDSRLSSAVIKNPKLPTRDSLSALLKGNKSKSYPQPLNRTPPKTMHHMALNDRQKPQGGGSFFSRKATTLGLGFS